MLYPVSSHCKALPYREVSYKMKHSNFPIPNDDNIRLKLYSLHASSTINYNLTVISWAKGRWQKRSLGG